MKIEILLDAEFDGLSDQQKTERLQRTILENITKIVVKDGEVNLNTTDSTARNNKVDKKSDSKYESKLLTDEAVGLLQKEYGFEVRKKRKYTKREDWKRPDLSREHEENRPDVRFQTRLDKDTDELVNQFLEATNTTKKDLVTKALREYITNNSHEPQ